MQWSVNPASVESGLAIEAKLFALHPFEIKLIPRLKDVGFHVHGSWFMVHRFNKQSTINGRCFLPSLKA